VQQSSFRRFDPRREVFDASPAVPLFDTRNEVFYETAACPDKPTSLARPKKWVGTVVRSPARLSKQWQTIPSYLCVLHFKNPVENKNLGMNKIK
jgi:hypothetical protein